MIKLNDTNSANINVLGEDELTQVVGGCHRRPRHCGGGYWRKRNYGHCGGYDRYEGSEGYEGSDSSGDDYQSDDGFEGNNVQVASVDVTINIAQVQG